MMYKLESGKENYQIQWLDKGSKSVNVSCYDTYEEAKEQYDYKLNRTGIIWVGLFKVVPMDIHTFSVPEVTYI